MAEEFYRNAKAYDIAFQDREFDVECDFLEWCLKNHGKVKKSKLKDKSFLELACGPARHAREMNKRGWTSYALDLSKEMVEFAESEAETENLKITGIVGDMTKYKLKNKVMLTSTLMESISHLVTNKQMISHFKSVAKNLVSGGIYVIEASHPQFFFPDEEANTWESKEGDTKVEITFGVPSDKYNTVTQQWLTTTKMKITEGKNPARVSETKTPLRWYLAQELKALIELSGSFDKYWFYGSLYYLPPKELDESEESDSMVVVLRAK
ncbi:MAG: class I SAM-dependent methyltransferase [Ignavibacteria bacterium]|jgi:SAM-dependent methyltransferase